MVCKNTSPRSFFSLSPSPSLPLPLPLSLSRKCLRFFVLNFTKKVLHADAVRYFFLSFFLSSLSFLFFGFFNSFMPPARAAPGM